MVESGHTQQNFCNATLICILFKKVFIPAWTLEETENVLETLETQGYEQAQDVEVWLVVFTVIVNHDLPVQTL